MTKPKDRPTVQVRPHSYQPSKAEIDEMGVIHKKDGTVSTPDELVRIALQPMKTIEDSDA